MSSLIVENILTFVRNTDFDEILVDEVLKKLEIIGIDIASSEVSDIVIGITRVDEQIKNKLNLDHIPYNVHSIVTDRVCGEVLYIKYLKNELPENLEVDEAIKQLSIGDTTVSYDTNSQNKVMALIGFLKTSGEGELCCYRKIKW